MHIALVHGFNEPTAGRETIDKMAKYLRSLGHTVDTDSCDYGYHELIMVRFFYRKAVKRIRAALEQCDLIIGHSNGANYITKALKKHDKPIKVVYIAPALNRKTKVPECVTDQYVFHSNADKPTKWAKLLFKHPWGDMGRKGYNGTDPRVTNLNYNHIPHSDWFSNAWCKRIADKIHALL